MDFVGTDWITAAGSVRNTTWSLLEEANAEFAAGIGDVFAMRVLEFDGVPELFDVRVGVIASDVVKDDEATGAHQWRVHFPILRNASVGVIAIEEQHVDGAAGQEVFGLIQSGD